MQTTMHTLVWENIWDLVTMVIMQRQPLNPGDHNTGSTVYIYIRAERYYRFSDISRYFKSIDIAIFCY